MYQQDKRQIKQSPKVPNTDTEFYNFILKIFNPIECKSSKLTLSHLHRALSIPAQKYLIPQCTILAFRAEKFRMF